MTVVISVSKSKRDMNVIGGAHEELTLLDAIDVDKMLAALHDGKTHLEAGSDRGDRIAVQQEGAAVLVNVGSQDTEANVQVSAGMRADGGGIHVALDLEVIVLTNGVDNSLVHGADVVAVELDVLAAGDHVHRRLRIHGRGFMELQVVKLFPCYVAEGDELHDLTLEFNLSAMARYILLNIMGLRQGIIDFKIITVNALEGVGHILFTLLGSMRTATATTDSSTLATETGLKIISGLKGVLPHL